MQSILEMPVGDGHQFMSTAGSWQGEKLPIEMEE
jgi:hypothetical protein